MEQRDTEPRWRVFLAGILQGSLTEPALHDQQYRQRIRAALARWLPEARLYDPLAEHRNSLGYDEQTGRRVFFAHNRMCRRIDVLVAYVPEASMGTAIEMWEAYNHGAAVVTISPLEHNWAVRFLSHALYASLDEFEAALSSGQLRRCVEDVLAARRGGD